MRRVFILLAWALAIHAAAQEQPAAGEDSAPVAGAPEAAVTDAPPAEEEGAIYRSVGEDGSIVFSDSPSPGAEKVRVQETQTIDAPPPPTFVYERPQAPAAPYSRVEIVEPANDAQIRENTGNINVSVVVEPGGLGAGDRLVLLMDGQQVAEGQGQQTSFSLENIDRGTHQLKAVVRGHDGKTVHSSPSVTFHMLRFREGAPKPAPLPKPKK